MNTHKDTQPDTVEENWIKRFDELYGFEQNGNAVFTVPLVENGVKQFIQSEINAAKQQGAEEALKKVRKQFKGKMAGHYPADVFPTPPDSEKCINNAAAELMRTLGNSVAERELETTCEVVLEDLQALNNKDGDNSLA